DEVYRRYRADPASVDPSWRRFFENGAGVARDGNGQAAALAEAAAARPAPLEAAPIAAGAATDERFARVYALVNAFRVRGHLEASLDPLDHLPHVQVSDLDPRTWGFTDADLKVTVPSGGMFGVRDLPLGELLARLRATYCGPIGVEMMHITETE